jgi:flagellar M-ring protein FliF
VTFVQMIAFGVVGFGIIILTARSIFAALNRPTAGLSIADAAAREVGGGGSLAIGQQRTATLGIAHSGAGAATGGGGGGQSAAAAAAAAADEEDTLTMNNIQGQMRASSIRKVTQLVDRHPDTTLGILRAWMALDQR